VNYAPIFAFTDEDGWHPGIGDPTVVGWITVFAYFVAAFLSFRSSRSTTSRNLRKQKWFWNVLTIALVLLGINKQLDLQTWLTLILRKLAIHEGLYEKRRLFQAVFIVFMALSGVIGFRWMWRLVSMQAREVWLALAGLFFLLVFIVIRAASFHHIDSFLKFDIGGFRMNWLLELGGISLIAVAAYQSARRNSRTHGAVPPASRYCAS
jgi:hypothetical protein